MAVSTLGVPCKLLKEFLNRKVTVETGTGEIYKGVIVDCEDNMSMSLTNVKVTFIDGRTVNMEDVYIKGSCIRLINLPDTAKDSLASLTRDRGFRGRGGFRGGRGGGGRGGGRRDGGSKPSYKSSYDRRRY